MSATNSHPHFDDKGTHQWFVTLEGGMEQAKRAGKMILIEFGRTACGDCRNMVESVLIEPAVADKLNSYFVAVAADADSDDEAIMKLVMQVQDPSMLPFVMFADAEGQFLDGFSGWRSAKDLLEMMDRLITQRQ